MDKTEMLHELLDAVWGPDWHLPGAERRPFEEAWDEAIEQVREWRDGNSNTRGSR